MRRILIALGLAAALVATAGPARADKRVALIIGNSTYRNIPRLDNPLNDAKLMAETLRALGFTLVGNGAQLDLEKASFDSLVQDFGNQLQGADVGMFYYAGHGLQVRGSNYLVPVGANPTRETDVDFQMVDMALVLRQMESAGTKLNLVILDACRNNPFGGRGLRAADGGLAQMRAPEGTLISFSTQPGNVAQDGADGNSPYTKALAQTMRRGGLDIFQTFNEVGLAVKRTTGGAQQPWVSTSPIDGSFYFAGRPAAAAGTDEIAWGFVKEIGSPDQLRAFIAQFPSSNRKSDAEARIAALEKKERDEQHALEEGLRRRAVAALNQMGAPQKPPSQVGSKPSQESERPPQDNKVALLPVPDQPSSSCGSQSAIGASLSSRSVGPLSAGEECGLKPKDVFKECDKCPEMVAVPAGSFTMGSPYGEKQRHGDEDPHKVTIARPFAVGRFAVTYDEWLACLAEGACVQKPNENWGRGRSPIVGVSWEDANVYVGWLSAKTGKTYRLLSESEREYVTRAGTTTPFWWGTSISTEQANYNGGYTYGDGPQGENRGKTVPVDSFSPNPWGLYQVHGNVWEWTEDCWNGGYGGAPSDGSAWTSGDCAFRVMRGGSWNSTPVGLRAAQRLRNASGNRGDINGFRVARTLSR